MSEIFSAIANGKAMFVFALLLTTSVVHSYETLKFLDKILSLDPAGRESQPCPENLTVSWLSKPPLFTELPVTNSSESDYHFDGILYKVLDLALQRCCVNYKREEGFKQPTLLYKLQANKSVLHEDILDDKADLFLPVQSDEEEVYLGYLPYLKLLESPGIALIQRTSDSQRGNDKNILLWNAITSCWPIVVLTLLLSLVAGMCVWALETKKNTQEFGDVFDGFWWAFVTITTVGYGDKTPKSIIARLFTVFWIMIGVTICSILTATLSSSLTSIRVETAEVFPGMKVGVVSDSIALQKAEDLGMEVTVFEDLDEVYDALVDERSVDGMLEEVLTAKAYLGQKDNSSSSIVHIFEEKHGYGVAFNLAVKNRFDSSRNWQCMFKVIKFARDTKYAVKNEHRINKKFTEKHTPPEEDAQVEFHNVIDQKSPLFLGTVFGLVGVALVFFTVNVMLKCFRGHHKEIQSQDVKTGQKEGRISHENVATAWDGKLLEFSVTEFVAVPLTQKSPEKKGF